MLPKLNMEKSKYLNNLGFQMKRGKFSLFLILVAFALMIIPSASAVLLGSGLTLNATVSNSTMTFTTINVTVDEADVNNNSITLYNASYSNGALTIAINTTMNYTTINSNIDSSSFPSLGSIDNVNRATTIVNSFPQTLQATASITGINQCSSIGSFTFTPASGIAQTIYKSNIVCSGTTATISLNAISQGTGTLSWSQGCSSGEKGIVLAIEIMVALAIVVVIFTLYFYKGELNLNITPGMMIWIFIILMICIAFFIPITNSIFAYCGT